jgi:ribosomal protein S18 acetylase RimI-like enzyme
VGTDSAVMLRLARAVEAPVLASMSRDLIEVGLSWRYTPRRIAALIGEPDTVVLVAADGSDPEGFAAMQFGDDNAHLVLMCVRAARQRRGLGRSLHEWLLKSARVAGIGSITLELRADNAGALAFYGALGYDAQDIVAGYYDGRVAARRMALRLHQDVSTPRGEPPL